jgi:hypothetical protein
VLFHTGPLKNNLFKQIDTQSKLTKILDLD